MSDFPPAVLCFSGHDPSGGAGVQADIETLTCHRCHAVSVITALTEQDTCNVKNIFPQNKNDFFNQAQTLLNDIPIRVIKIGLIGSIEIAQAIAEILNQYLTIPVVLDTVLAAGGGKSLSNSQLIETINKLLIPRATIITPNTVEARSLTGLTNLSDCGLSLLKQGAKNVLITGTHENTHEVINTLYSTYFQKEYRYTRLPYNYHGSGCTLASSIAAFLAHEKTIIESVEMAQNYTWQTLNNAYQTGKGQYNPQRINVSFL